MLVKLCLGQSSFVNRMRSLLLLLLLLPPPPLSTPGR
jgi:hypothetical protein